MNILLIFTLTFFILAFIVALYYEHKIRRIKLMNKVHFYVTCEVNYHSGGIIRTLWFGKPIYNKEDKKFVPDKVKRSHILDVGPFASYNLRYFDFDDMMEGEIREVFLSTED